MNMQKISSFCRVSVIIQISPQGADKIRVVFPVIILKLKNVIVNADFQSLIVTVGKKVQRKCFRAEKQILIRTVDIG